MSFGIIIRGGENRKSFRPHHNVALGGYIHTREDYLKGLKKHNLIPQAEAQKIAAAKRREMNKDYKPTKWAHEMVEVVRRSNGKPGSAFYDQLAKRGYDVNKMAKSKKQYDKHFKNNKDVYGA